MLNKIYGNQFFYFISLLVLQIFSAHLFSFLCPFVLGEEECYVKYSKNTDGLIKLFLVGSIFGPLIETAIFQYLPITIYKKYITSKSKNKELILIIISALIFGLTHNYNLFRIIDATIAGIIFAFIFFYFSGKGKSGFFYTFLIHAIFNTYVFILVDVLKIA
jgi:membrane protease YdiL (CAAX protease family)